MNIAKYPFAVLSAALFTVMLITPISSVSNLIWLSSVDMPVNISSSLEVLLFDFQRLGIALYGVIILGFAIALAVFLMVELLFKTELLGGNRTILGKGLHWLAGFIGGYFYYWLISKEKNYTFIIRYLGILYSYVLLGAVLDWIFTPSNAASGFGFVLQELSNEGQNALIRDFTSFFFATCV